ncbi:MAG: hypothetical protein R3F30_13905 [Planctomycetota bacterium]
MAGLDWAVVAAYLLLVAAIGLWNARGQDDTEDYFLGGHRIPWWVAGVSILATETSALTFLGAPTQSLRADWTYAQLLFGSILGRLLVAALLIGVYYRARVFTVYSYLGQRFGPGTRRASVGLFFVGRCLGSGVRLYGAALALVVLLPELDRWAPGWGFELAIALVGLVALLYTTTGGLRSVVWTDTVQGLLLFVGGGLALVWLIDACGGPGEALAGLLDGRTAAGTAKLRLLHSGFEHGPGGALTFRFDEAYTLVGGVIGACFLTMSTHGTDQDMIQRALACKDAAGGRKSLWLSAVLAFPIVFLFLSIGSLLWLKLGGDAAVDAQALALSQRIGKTEASYDLVFPAWVLASLPSPAKGLVFCGLFAAAMSSLDSAISALSTTFVKNVWQPWLRPGRPEREYLRAARWASLGFGLLLIAIAVFVWHAEPVAGRGQGFGVLKLGLEVLSWIFPPLLGIFLLGALTRRGSDAGNLLALALGIGVLLVPGKPFAWIWNPLVGCGLTFGIAVLFPGRPAEADA